ncbi:hypothetical protein CWI80_06340 [Pseudidiomarina sediminum]|uniref:Uncharacterized protein n=1 Tax=Pseudidiomarina sediminum TaxID=431675 RepID=A0A432ZAJ9_9GAMM|nr:hypothetical protein [Pseudidiomarina sediminum]RUO74944.1 hypothetical protein CWI80_06340 [Pseudidiomarina sediminum]
MNISMTLVGQTMFFIYALSFIATLFIAYKRGLHIGLWLLLGLILPIIAPVIALLISPQQKSTGNHAVQQ